MKKHAMTLLMVVLAVALGVWLWLDRDRITSGEQKARVGLVFPIWRRDELREITIHRDDETLVLMRDASEWKMSSPRTERVDAAAVDRLLSTLEFASIARRASDGTSLGLAPPRASGHITMGRLVVKFALGGSSPRPENSSYFRIDDGEPIVVGKELEDALLASSDVYRDRTVVPYVHGELTRLEATFPGGGFVLDRVDERAFVLAGEGLLASRASVDRLWAALAEMRAEAFPSEADVDRLVQEPSLTITMTPKDRSRAPAQIVIGDACPGRPSDVVVLRKTPSRKAACAPKDVAAAFRQAPGALVERHPFTRSTDEIEELRLERLSEVDAGSAAPTVIEIARKGTGFRQREPAARDLSEEESDAANELLARLTKEEAIHVNRESGPFTPIARARIRYGDFTESVEIGAPDANHHATVRRVLDRTELDAPPSLVRLLLPRETTLRAGRILETQSRRARRVSLRCGSEQVLTDQGDGFRMVSPAGFQSDSSIVQLIDAILKGHDVFWVSDGVDGSFGFDRNDCGVTITLDGDEKPHSLTFGDAGEGGVYARVDTRRGVFVAPKALRDLAGQIYVSRGSLRVEASRIESVRVVHAGQPIVGDAQALRDAVASLYADRVVAFGTQGLPEAELKIDVILTDGGAPLYIRCRSAGDEHLCTATGTNATFALKASRFAPFLPQSDGGTGHTKSR